MSKSRSEDLSPYKKRSFSRICEGRRFASKDLKCNFEDGVFVGRKEIVDVITEGVKPGVRPGRVLEILYRPRSRSLEYLKDYISDSSGLQT